MINTLTFSEDNKGWTSFWNYKPDQLCSLDNRFFSIKDGNLYIHHDEENPIPNTFYGVKSVSKMITIFNDAPSDDKIFKTIELEGTHAWETKVKTNYTEGDIKQTEYNKRESRFFAYIRKNILNPNFFGIGTQGIGSILSITGNTITFAIPISDAVNIGDDLYMNGTLIGVINGINANSVIVNTFVNPPAVNGFCFAQKNNRIEGAEIRGYYMEIELTNNDNNKVELFGVNSNAVKSFV
jgi:hypothetical protein